MVIIKKKLNSHGYLNYSPIFGKKCHVILFSGKFYNYDSYCSMYEDVFEWILDAFDDLNNMEDLADDLETIKIQVTFNS